MDDKKTKFSVLMSVYKKDKCEQVKEAIESIINQTVKPDEIVIVEDGPIPETIEKLVNDYQKEKDGFKIVSLKKNVGLGNALNAGLKECSYDLVARMDSDDVSVKDRFEKQLKEFEKDTTLSVVGGWISEFVEEVTKSVGIREVPLNNEDIAIQIKSKNPFNHMSVMFRKKDVLEAGGYQDFFYYEDYYLWIRMLLKNMKFKNINSVLVNARIGEDMYQRRGGWKYYKSGVKLQNFMLKNKLIDLPKYCYNILVRFVVQVMMPNRFRAWMYQKFARK